jgi:hypothetical protein
MKEQDAIPICCRMSNGVGYLKYVFEQLVIYRMSASGPIFNSRRKGEISRYGVWLGDSDR